MRKWRPRDEEAVHGCTIGQSVEGRTAWQCPIAGSVCPRPLTFLGTISAEPQDVPPGLLPGLF